MGNSEENGPEDMSAENNLAKSEGMLLIAGVCGRWGRAEESDTREHITGIQRGGAESETIVDKIMSAWKENTD